MFLKIVGRFAILKKLIHNFKIKPRYHIVWTEHLATTRFSKNSLQFDTDYQSTCVKMNLEKKTTENSYKNGLKHQEKP